MRVDGTRTAVVLSTAAMEASWLYALLVVLTVRPDPAMAEPVLDPLALFGLLAGPLAYIALLESLGLHGRIARASTVLLVALAAVGAAQGGWTGQYLRPAAWWNWWAVLSDLTHPQFGRALFGLLAALLLCLRGLSLYRMEPETPVRSFRLGVVVDSFAILIGALFLLDIEAVGGRLLGAVLSFFFFGLLGVAVAQLRRSREKAGLRWFLVFVPVIALILIGGVIGALLLSPNVADLLLSFWEGLTGAVIWLVTPLAVASYALWQLLMFLFRTRPVIESRPSETPLIQTIAPLTPEGETAVTPTQLPAAWQFAISGVLIGLIVVGVLYLVWRTLSRRRNGDDVPEERESLWAWEGVSLALPDWLARLRRPADRAARLRDLLGRLAGPPTTVAVRRAYIYLLLLALEKGGERRAGQTPWEYLPDLHRCLPEHAAESDVLTRAYIRARYDPRPAPLSLAQRAEEAWQKVALRERLRGSRTER